MSRRRSQPLIRCAVIAAALVLLFEPGGCSWVEWPPEQTTAAPPPVAAEQPAPEPTVQPTKPPPPRPAAAAPAPAPTAPTAPPATTSNFDGRHVVTRGETLFSIARLYDVDTFTLASLNGLRPPYGIEVGQVLKVPGAAAPPPAASTAPRTVDEQPLAPPTVSTSGATTVTPPTGPAEPPPPKPVTEAEADHGAGTPAVAEPVPEPRTAALDNSVFTWPVRGEIVSRFGARADGSRNDGIDIAAKQGAPVRAARSGRVHYAGNQLKSYGNMVLIKHDDGWWTLYAHTDQILVREGEAVKKGDVIARVGASGDVAKPLLHFEMRQGKKAVDPLRYLPPARS
jgi:murein DD-endopeptidase MepM/ murein hydrolase activator NlpD